MLFSYCHKQKKHGTNTLRFTCLYRAVCRLFDVFVQGDGADGVGYDASAGWVLDILYMSADVGIHIGVFKYTVTGSIEGTVLQNQMLGVAKKLFACQMAVYKPYIGAVPCKVLAIEQGIVNGHVLALPEGILSHDLGIVDFHVLAVLEHVFGIALEAVYTHIVTEHERISAVVDFEVAGEDVTATPEYLISIVDADIFKFYVVHLTKHLRSINHRIRHLQTAAVPQGRTSTYSKTAVVDAEAMDMPERILAFKIAVFRLYVSTLLYSALALSYRHLLQTQTVGFKERTLSFKFLILNYLHMFNFVA